MKQIVFILGSESDKPFAAKIQSKLNELSVSHQLFVASAHKSPKKVLEILERFEEESDIVFITLAGRSNALSGFCGANSRHPVIACPPFADKVDMLVNIHSTLQMPSNTPVLTILDPENAALAAAKILR
jgi:5-(carboxyamino)imidazole ribonucleotide mutase